MRLPHVDGSGKVAGFMYYSGPQNLGTRPNISESHSEISTRVPYCIAGDGEETESNSLIFELKVACKVRPSCAARLRGV